MAQDVGMGIEHGQPKRLPVGEANSRPTYNSIILDRWMYIYKILILDLEIAILSEISQRKRTIIRHHIKVECKKKLYK